MSFRSLKRGIVFFFLLVMPCSAQNPISELRFVFSGFTAAPAQTELYGLVRTELQVPMVFSASPEKALGREWQFRAVLSSAALQEDIEITAPGSAALVIPGHQLAISGDYVLRDIRLESTSSGTVTARPSSVTLHILENVLSTSVETSLLSPEEMAELGIQVSPDNYSGYEVNISLGLESGTETLSIPFFIPADSQEMAGWEGESAFAQVGDITFPRGGKAGSVGVGTIKRSGGGDGEQGLDVTLPAIVYFPGNVGYLHHFFKALVVVVNTAPDDADIVVKDLEASLVLPPGPDEISGTPENPGDDPLRPALTEEGYIDVRILMNPGPDGELGTSDDHSMLHTGESGICYFLLEGLQEGTHTVGFDLNGTVEATGLSDPISGEASGKVLVRNPDLAVSFAHPRTVRTGYPYDLTVTVTNTSTVVANNVYLQFDSDDILGGYFMDDAGNAMSVVREMVESADGTASLQPGETGRVRFRVMPLKTGSVVASYLQTETGSISLKLEHGVDDRGVALSPDTIHLSWPFYELPSDYRTALELLLGDALSVATAPSLPAGVMPIYGRGLDDEVDEIQQLAEQMILAGLYGHMGEGLNSMVIRNIAGFRWVSPGIEQLYRRSEAGHAVRRTEADILADALNQQGLKGFMEAVGGGLCDIAGIRTVLLHRFSEVELTHPESGTHAVTGENIIPGTVLIPLSDDQTLLILGDEAATYRIDFISTATDSRIIFTRGHDLTVFSGFASPQCRGNLMLGTDEQARTDQDGNGSFETVLREERTRIDFPAPSLVGVRQLDPEFLPGASVYGDELIAVFNRSLSEDTLASRDIYSVTGNSIIRQRTTRDGRSSLIRLQKPVGHFEPRTLRINPLQDAYGEYAVPAESEIMLSDLLQGFYLEGQVVDSDGNPLARHRMDAYVSGYLSHHRRFVMETDGTGHFVLEHTTCTDRYPMGVQLKVVHENKRRHAVVKGRLTGQRIRRDIHFTGTGTVTVQVLTGEHEPVQEAEIALSHHVELYNRSAVTDENGCARFEHVHVGPFSVHAVKQFIDGGVNTVYSGVASGNLVRAGGKLDVTVFMEHKTGTVSGRLLEEQLNDAGETVYEPIAGEAVVVFCEFENTGGGGFQRGNIVIVDGQGYVPVNWQYSDPDGNFHFPSIPAGRFFLQVTTDTAMYAGTGVPYLLTEKSEQQVTLLRTNMIGSVYGMVRDGAGMPLSGVEVGAQLSGVVRYVRTDQDGMYELTGMPAGAMSLRAKMGGLIAAATAYCTSDQPRVRCDLAFPPVGSVSGTLYDAEGRPLAGRRVVIPPYDPNAVIADPLNGAIYNDPQRSCITNETGYYQMENIALGTHELTTIQGYRGGNTEFSILASGEHVHADLHLLPAGRVEGRVLQSDGVTGAVARVSLSCNLPSRDIRRYGRIEMGTLGTVVTDSDGSFSFDHVNAGPVYLQATNVFASESANIETRLLNEDEVVHVELELGEQPSGQIVGTVYLPDGSSVAGPGVNITLRSVQFPEMVIQTMEGGSFASPDILPAGSWTVVAVDPVTGWKTASRVVLPENSRVHTDLRLRGYGTVSLSVSNPDGMPVPFGMVTFNQFEPDGFWNHTTVHFDSPDGTIYFDRVYEGEFDISVVASDGRSGRVTGGISRDGQHLDLSLMLSETGSIGGTVLMPDGVTPVPNVELTMVDLVAGETAGYGTSSSMPGETGTFFFDHLKPGDYAVVAFDVANGRSGEVLIHVDAAASVTDLALQLRGSGTVTGQVTDGAGNPASAVRVKISAGTDPAAMDAELYRYAVVELDSVTDADGCFRFEGIPEGPFEVVAHSDETGASGVENGRLATDGEVVDIRISLAATGTVQVTAMRHDGDPLPYAGITLERTPFPPQMTGTLTVHQVADERGMTRFRHIPIGFIVLSATDTAGLPAGTASCSLDHQGQVQDVSLRAPGRGAVYGSVVKSDGTPVTAGIVKLRTDNTVTEVAISVTGYRFASIPYGPFTVTVNVENQSRIVDQTLTDDPLSGRVDIVLAPTGRVSGELTDHDGNPVANCAVSLQVDNHAIGVRVTDAAGLYQFDSVPYGRVSVNATRTITGEKAVGGGILDASNSQLVIPLTFQPLGTITGQLLDRDGGIPVIPGARVTVRCLDSGYSKSVPVMSNGTFELIRIPMGPYRLTYQDDWSFNTTIKGTLREDQPAAHHSLQLVDYRTVQGRVLDVAGDPVADASIVVSGDQQRSTWTDDLGYFTLHYARFGTLLVKATAPEGLHRATGTVVVSSSSPEPVELALNFTGMLRLQGTVWQDGARVRGIPVRETGTGVSGWTAADGTFALDLPVHPDASYTLEAIAGTAFPLRGLLQTTLPPEQNVDGSVVGGMDITIEPAASLSGTVAVMSDGAPLQGATVMVHCRGAGSGRTTDAAGRFAFDELPLNEPIVLTVSHGQIQMEMDPVVLTSDTELPVIELDTTPPVITPGMPLPDSELSLPFELVIDWDDPESGIDPVACAVRVNGSTITGSGSISETGFTMAVQSLDGGFRYGANTLNIRTSNGQGSETSLSFEFSISEIPTSISGRVFRADGTTPAAGLAITLTAQSGVFETITETDGHYRFESIGLGDYTIEAMLEAKRECLLVFGALDADHPEQVRDLRMYRYGAVSGTVFGPPDETGERLPVNLDNAARVQVLAVINGQSVTLTGETDDTGAYEVSRIPMGFHDMDAQERDGNHFTHTRQIELRETLDEIQQDLNYLALGTVSGQVRDAEGVAVTTGRVTLTVMDPDARGFHLDETDLTTAGYAFETVPEGQVRLQANCDGLTGSADAALDYEGQEVAVDIQLEPNRIVTGRILLTDGTPAPAVSVLLQTETGGVMESMTTAADGMFRFDHLSDRSWRIVASGDDSSGHGFVRSDLFDFTGGTEVDLGDLQFAVNEPPVLEIVGVSPEGSVYAGASVVVSVHMEDNEGLDRVVLSASGVFEQEVASALYNRTSQDRDLELVVPADVVLSAGNTLTLTVSCIDSAGETVLADPIEMTVLTDTTPPVFTIELADGTAMADGHTFEEPPVSFNVWYADPETGIDFYGPKSADVNGVPQTSPTHWLSDRKRFLFDQLEEPLVAGTNSFQVTISNGAGIPATVSGTFEVGFNYVLEGQVTDPDGNPVGAGCPIVIRSGSLEYQVETDATGHYRFDSIRHSVNYEIFSEIPDQWWCIQDTISIDSGTQLNQKDLKYYEFGRITGTVFRARKFGEPEDLREPYTGPIRIYADESRETWVYADTGSILLDYLPLGEYAVHSYKAAYGIRLGWETNIVPVTLDQTNHEAVAELFVPELNTATGVFLDAEGQRIGNHDWQLINTETGETVYSYIGYSSDTWTLYEITPGRYRVTTRWRPESLPGTSAEFEVIFDGETQTADVILEPYRSITGMALLPDGTTPAAGADVLAEAWGYSYTTTCAADGTFRLDHVYNKPFVLTITHAEGSFATTGRFDASATVDIGTVQLQADRPPTAMASLEITSIMPSGSFRVRAQLADDNGLMNWGYRLSGVLDSGWNEPISGSPTEYSDTVWIDVPYDTDPGDLVVEVFAIDSEGQEGTAEPLTIQVEDRYLDYRGTVYRADGLTPAEGAQVNATWTCESSDGPFTNGLGATVEPDGRFVIANLFDRGSNCDRGSSYAIRVVWQDGGDTEVYAGETPGTPETDLDEMIVLAPPEPPVLTVEYNAELPLYIDEMSDKPMILHVDTDWNLERYGYEVTGMFEDIWEDYPDPASQAEAWGFSIRCPDDWFWDGPPTPSGQISVTAYATDEFGQTTRSDPVPVNVESGRADLTGRLLKPDGTAAVGAEVTALLDIWSPFGGPVYMTDSFYTTTGEDGRFVFEDLLLPARFRSESIRMSPDWVPEGLTVEEATIQDARISGFYLDEDEKAVGTAPITELPSGDLELGDITLQTDPTPDLAVTMPTSGDVVAVGDELPVVAHVRSDNLPVTAETWFGTDETTAVALTDEGEDPAFHYAGRSGYHRFTGTVTIPAEEGSSWDTRLPLTVRTTDDVGWRSSVELELRSFTLEEGESLPVPATRIIFPLVNTAVPTGLPGQTLPIHIEDVDGNPVPFHFGPKAYDPADLETGGGGGTKGAASSGKGPMLFADSGYGELLDTHLFSAGHRLQLKVDVEGTDPWLTKTLNLEAPATLGYEMLTAADLTGNLAAYQGADVVLTEGQLTIDGAASFRNLIVVGGATVELSGDGSLTVDETLVLMPGADLLNINPGGTPTVVISGTDAYLYGDYSGKNNGSGLIDFQFTGGVYEQPPALGKRR